MHCSVEFLSNCTFLRLHSTNALKTVELQERSGSRPSADRLSKHALVNSKSFQELLEWNSRHSRIDSCFDQLLSKRIPHRADLLNRILHIWLNIPAMPCPDHWKLLWQLMVSYSYTNNSLKARYLRHHRHRTLSVETLFHRRMSSSCWQQSIARQNDEATTLEILSYFQTSWFFIEHRPTDVDTYDNVFQNTSRSALAARRKKSGLRDGSGVIH